MATSVDGLSSEGSRVASKDTIIDGCIAYCSENKGKEADHVTDNKPEQMSNWADLTHEVLVDIFSRLDLEERWRNISLVCNGWFKAAKDPCLWTVVDFEEYFSKKRETNTCWTTEFEKRMDKMVKVAVDYSCGGLRELHVRHCSDEALGYLAERCPNLQRLSIKACQSVTDMSVCQIALRCSKIEELDISYCHNITYASLEKIGRNCQHLTVVKRNMLNWIDPSEHREVVPTEYMRAAPLSGDDEAAVFAKYMPNLKRLEMRFSKLSPKGLRVLVDGCLNLEYLVLFGCPNLTCRALDHASESLKNLKELVKPNSFAPRSAFHFDRYGHWQLYDERFQTNVFQI